MDAFLRVLLGIVVAFATAEITLIGWFVRKRKHPYKLA